MYIGTRTIKDVQHEYLGLENPVIILQPTMYGGELIPSGYVLVERL
jgi:hypothetical protein